MLLLTYRDPPFLLLGRSFLPILLGPQQKGFSFKYLHARPSCTPEPFTSLTTSVAQGRARWTRCSWADRAPRHTPVPGHILAWVSKPLRRAFMCCPVTSEEVGVCQLISRTGRSGTHVQQLWCRLFLITDVDTAAVQRLLLVAVLLCGRCLPGDPEIGGTEVFRASPLASALVCCLREGWRHRWALHLCTADPADQNLSADPSTAKHLCQLIFIKGWRHNRNIEDFSGCPLPRKKLRILKPWKQYFNKLNIWHRTKT